MKALLHDGSRVSDTSGGAGLALARRLLPMALMLLLAPVVVRAQSQQRLTVEGIIRLVKAKVAEPRLLTLIADACVQDGASAASQRALATGGASERVQRTVAKFACRDESSPPPLTRAADSTPPSPPVAPVDPGARLGLGDDQFVLVRQGRFVMGSATGGETEQPVHEVTLTRAFRLQVTEVTQGQWRAVVGANPSRNSACGDACPVDNVSWNDVQDFIARLNSLTGRQYRLPTEAEWEYAARAGASGDDVSDLQRVGWHAGNAGGRAHPARQRAPNAWGLYDVRGNLWEWVQDYHARYSPGEVTDPMGPSSGEYRVLRGGSWFDSAEYARTTTRDGLSPTFRNDAIGFRLVMAP